MKNTLGKNEKNLRKKTKFEKEDNF